MNSRFGPNGINFETGEPLRQVDLSAIAALAASGSTRDPGRESGILRLAYDIDPANIAAAGWGLIVPRGMDTGSLSGLRSLIERRKSQVAPRRFRLLEYWPGE